MKTFEVRIYFSGYVTREIEAADEGSAVLYGREKVMNTLQCVNPNAFPFLPEVKEIIETLQAWPDADTAEELETEEDDDPKLKHYEFKVILAACGNSPEEAWQDVKESIAADGLGEFEPDSIITEEDMEL